MMLGMFGRSTAAAALRSARVSGVALAVTAALALASCSGGDSDVVEAAVTTTSSAPATTEPTPTSQPASNTTTAPATTEPDTATAPPTTSEPAPTSTTTSTLFVDAPETTLVVEAPDTTLVVDAPEEPIAPPVDSYAQEPIIEVGSIAIPKLGVDMTMYEGIRLTTLDYGPGHWPGTAMPGEVGNVVVGGHRTSSHRVFRDVDQLVPGDEVVFRDGRGTHTYSVNRVEVVEPTAVWIVNPTETATATLFACHPPGSTAQRIVVFADYVATDA